MVLGPLLCSFLLGEGGEGRDRPRMNMVWLVSGAFMASGCLLTEIAFAMIRRHPVIKGLDMTEADIRMALESNAMNKDQFIEEMVSLLRAMMTKGNPQFRNLNLCHGDAQNLVRRLLNETIPFLRPYDESTKGREYLEDIAKWLGDVGTQQEQDNFSSRFPDI